MRRLRTIHQPDNSRIVPPIRIALRSTSLRLSGSARNRIVPSKPMSGAKPLVVGLVRKPIEKTMPIASAVAPVQAVAQHQDAQSKSAASRPGNRNHRRYQRPSSASAADGNATRIGMVKRMRRARGEEDRRDQIGHHNNAAAGQQGEQPLHLRPLQQVTFAKER